MAATGSVENGASGPGNATRARRWAWRTGLGLVIVYALYLLAANVFLNTALGPWAANRKPDRFQIQWGPAWSLWPGRVSARDVRLQGATASGQRHWQVQAAWVHGRIALLPLLRREVRVPWVEATDLSGGSWKLPATDTAAVRAAVPRTDKPAWRLRFERIHSDSMRAGRFDELRLTGTGEVSVAFIKDTRGGPFQLLPSALDMANAQLSLGEQVLVRQGRLQAQVAIDGYRPRQVRGVQVLALADIHARLHGQGPALSLHHDDRGRVHLRTAAAGHGQVQADLHWAHGELASGSRLRWQAPLQGTDLAGQPLASVLNVEAGADRDLYLRAQLPGDAQAAQQADIDLTAQGRQVPLQAPRSLLPRLSGHARGRWSFDSLGWITRLFPQAGWLALEGHGQVDADLRLEQGRPVAGSRIQVPDLDAVAELMGNRFSGRASADLQVVADAQGRAQPQLALRMQRFEAAAVDTPKRPFVQGRDLALDLQADAGDGSVDALRDSSRAHLVFRNASVPDLRAYNRYLPAQMNFEGGSGRLSGDLNFQPGGLAGDGRLQVQASAARLRVAELAVRSDVAVDLRLRHVDVKGERSTLDGSRVSLRNASFSEPGGQARSGWWATVDLDQARMDAKAPAVDGRFRVQARDVGFLLGLFTRQRDYPKWVFKAIDAGQVQASGRVHWQREQLVLDRLQASNQRFELAGRLRLSGPQQRQGSLYARWGVLDAALELQDDRRDWHLLRSRQWYDAQPDLLR